MKTRVSILRFLQVATLLMSSLLLAPGPAFARNTQRMLSVQSARESELGQAKLLDVPFFFKGAKHPPVAKVIGEWSSNRTSRGVFRSDEKSCEVAFLSAVTSLQKRARAEGGDAIIDIVSITGNRLVESAIEYRCVAGATIVHVGLRGKVVKLR